MSLLKRSVGVHPPYAKNTSGYAINELSGVPLVKIPVAMQIGPPPIVCVEVGQKVSVGEILAKPEAPLAVPVHSSVSGEILEIKQEIQSTGRPCDVIVIKNDKKFTAHPDLKAPEVNSKEEFLAAVRASGTVGLGGAGFPTHIKLSPPPDKKIDYLLVNGMECEPFITSDEWLMRNHAKEIIRALEKVITYCEIPKALIGLEDNTPEAYAAMKEAVEASTFTNKIELHQVQSIYPQGAETVMITRLTGRKVPRGGLPFDVGCLVMNVGSLYSIDTYLQSGMPLVSRFLTLDGPALNRAGLFKVPIGTRISDLIELSGGLARVPEKVIMGGPMMGQAVSDLDAPVIKMNNSILVLDHEMAQLPEEMACIHCGRCIKVCPVELMPTELDRYAREFKAEELDVFAVDACIECGSCSFVCPSKRYLLQNIRVGKQILRKYQNEQKAKAEAAKQKESQKEEA